MTLLEKYSDSMRACVMPGCPYSASESRVHLRYPSRPIGTMGGRRAVAPMEVFPQ